MKEIISVFLCLVFIFGFAACDGEESNSTNEKILAVEYGSVSSIAAEGYSSGGYSVVTYNSASDVVLAVENGKADYGILDEFQLDSYKKAERRIKKKAQCEYAIEYCVYFSAENESLQTAFNETINQLKSDGILKSIESKRLNGVAFNDVEYIKSDEKLIMLCDPSFPDRIYLNNKKEVVGMDVDIVKAICNSLGYEIEIVTADFDDLFTMLQDGEGDFVVSASQVSRERAENYLLSDPYFTLNFFLIEKE